jgi:hypothetical protein
MLYFMAKHGMKYSNFNTTMRIAVLMGPLLLTPSDCGASWCECAVLIWQRMVIQAVATACGWHSMALGCNCCVSDQHGHLLMMEVGYNRLQRACSASH